MPSIDAAAGANPNKSGSGRIDCFVWIRVIACAAIVLLHCVNAGRAYYKDVISRGEVLADNVVCSLLMWAVPCFLMVSGALLLNPERELTFKKLFGKYIKRMFVPLVIFTFIFTLIKYAAGERPDIALSFIRDLLQCQSMAYLWYLYLMIAIYLMLPFYKMVANAADDRLLCYLIGIIIFFNGILPLLSIAGITDIAFYIPTQIIYPAYFFAGHLLYRNNMPTVIAAAALAISTPLLAIVTFVFDGSSVDMGLLNGYSSFLVLVQSFALYSLFIRIKRPAGEFVSSIDRCSFGIYLVHMVFIRLVMKEGGINPFDYGPFGFIFMSIVFFFASYAVVWLIKKFTKEAIF